MQQELGEDRPRAADPNWPKGYSIPSDGMLTNISGWLAGVGGPAAWGLSGHRSAGGEQLHWASLVCIY